MERKILYTASTLSHIKNFHLPYLKWFHENGYTVHVAAGEGGSIPYADEVFPLPLQKSIVSPENFKVASQLKKRIAREGYNLISVHTSLAAFFTRLAVGGGKDRPIIVNTCHGYLFDTGTPFIRRNIMLTAERLMAGRTDLLFTMNREDLDIAKKYHLCSGNIIPIPGMGVDLTGFQPASTSERECARAALGFTRDDFIMICTAEFSARKNQSMLIRAMTRLPQRVSLLLLGSGALLDACRTLARRLKLEKRVRFSGFISDILPYLHAADVAVSASRYEGLPFNLMEAMAVGLPLVASNVKGNADLVSDGLNGYLYPYGDEAAFAERIKLIMETDCFVLGESGRKLMEAYSLAKAMETVTDAYATLLFSPSYAG